MKISHFCASDKGLKRENNEDYLKADDALGIYLLADGMGGHLAGETASRVAVKSVHDYFARYDTSPEFNIEKVQPYPVELSPDGRKLVYAVIRANNAVTQVSHQRDEYKGMGTTIVALLAARSGLYLAHVGDSRIYLWRGGKLTRLTEDHSVYFDELKKGVLKPEQIERLPFRHNLTRALGHMGPAKVDLKVVHPAAGDIFLLCSDGLTDMVEDERMSEIIAKTGASLEACASALVDTAKENGGIDNISVILLRVEGT